MLRRQCGTIYLWSGGIVGTQLKEVVFIIITAKMLKSRINMISPIRNYPQQFPTSDQVMPNNQSIKCRSRPSVLFFKTSIVLMTTFETQRLNILCIKFKIVDRKHRHLHVHIYWLSAFEKAAGLSRKRVFYCYIIDNIFFLSK